MYDLGCFPFVRTGRPDVLSVCNENATIWRNNCIDKSSHSSREVNISTSKRVFPVIWRRCRVSPSKSVVWPVSSVKWKAPQVTLHNMFSESLLNLAKGVSQLGIPLRPEDVKPLERSESMYYHFGNRQGAVPLFSYSPSRAERKKQAARKLAAGKLVSGRKARPTLALASFRAACFFRSAFDGL